MKKLLRFADCFVLLAAIIGCCLRIWMNNAGLENTANHPAWILLAVVSVGTLVFAWLVSRQAGDDNRYKVNFPRSVAGMVTYLALAAVLAYNGIMDFLAAGDLLEKAESLFAMVAAVTLAVTGIERFRDTRPAFFLHMIPCVYLALRMFLMGREFGSDPKIDEYLFTFLAAVSLIPAFYWLWAFDVKMGNRKQSIFWSLSAAYLCLIASFDSTVGWAFHILLAACLLGNICVLKPLTKPELAEAEMPAEEVPAEEEAPVEEAVAAEEEAATEEAPVEEETPVKEIAPAEEEKPAAPAGVPEEVDLDALLEELKQYLDSENV